MVHDADAGADGRKSGGTDKRAYNIDEVYNDFIQANN